MLSENLIINAAAGAGKTTRIVREAIAAPEQKILITTYTNNNESEIRKKFYEEHGRVPENVTIQTWFTFLLEHFVRPYQNAVYDKGRMQGLALVNFRSARGVAEAKVDTHYLAPGPEINIYSDKISKFGIRCNTNTNGAVISRLRQIFDHVYIDEVQDLAGWDLDIIELLFNSEINLTLVGDYRQSTFATNNAAKYKQHAGINIINKFQEWEQKNLCEIINMTHSYRCASSICELADSIFKDSPTTKSRNNNTTNHDGIFVVATENVQEYIDRFSPQILRRDRRTDCGSYQAMNFGESKGLGFDRVLIYPHGPLRALLQSGDFSKIKEPAKFYVAVTRARYSVAFVYDGETNIKNLEQFQPH